MKLVDFIVCDDIRQEVGGKLTLVGVYADRMVLSAPPDREISWPVPIRLGFFLRLYDDGAGKEADRFELELVLNRRKVLQRIRGELPKSREKKLLNISFVNGNLLIPEPGNLVPRVTLLKNNAGVAAVCPEIPFVIAPPPGKKTVH